MDKPPKEAYDERVKSAQKEMAFVSNFASALIKLRKAVQAHQGATLTAEEAAAVVDGFKTLQTKAKREKD